MEVFTVENALNNNYNYLALLLYLLLNNCLSSFLFKFSL